jgi:hypothetical protein
LQRIHVAYRIRDPGLRDELANVEVANERLRRESGEQFFQALAPEAEPGFLRLPNFDRPEADQRPARDVEEQPRSGPGLLRASASGA